MLLFHELTHVAADTFDFTTKESEALRLPAWNPTRAVLNAASYQGFAESAAYGREVSPVEPRTPGDA